MTLKVHDRPRGAGYWGKCWGVHRHTARRILRWVKGHYGAKVVWEVGPQRALVATQASLQVVQLLRAERNVILVMMGQDGRQPGPQNLSAAGNPATLTPVTRVQAGNVRSASEDVVTQEQFSRAIAELYRQIAELKNTRRGG